MTAEARVVGASLDLTTDAARIARAVQAVHGFSVAQVANAATLDAPCGRFCLSYPAAGTYSVRWPVSPQAGYLYVRRLNATGASASDTSTVSLVVRDGLGGSVTFGAGGIPAVFSGSAVPHPIFNAGRIGDQTAILDGLLDVDALVAAGLAGSDWELEIAVALTGAAWVLVIDGYELPRSIVDDSVTAGGVRPGIFAPGETIDAARFDRLLATLEAARTTQRTYLSLAWPETVVAATTPSVASDTYAPFALLADSAGTAVPFRFPPRRVHRPSAQGERARWRVLYRMSGGAAACKVQLSTLSSSSPYDSGSLAYTTSWAWSSWKDCDLRTTSTDTVEEVTLAGRRLTADGTVLWIAGVCLQEAVS